MKIVLLSMMYVWLNSVEIVLKYSPGFSVVEAFTVTISNGSATVVMGNESEIIKSEQIVSADYAVITKLNANYRASATDMETSEYSYIDDRQNIVVTIYGIGMIARQNDDVRILRDATMKLFKIVALGSARDSIKKNFKLWAD